MYTSDHLPAGLIISICMLENCIGIVEHNGTFAVLEDGRTVSGNELFLGDYTVGGYVLEVQEMKVLKDYIPAKGRLGLWEYPGDMVLSYLN